MDMRERLREGFARRAEEEGRERVSRGRAEEDAEEG
jgi:hypothetical protein